MTQAERAASLNYYAERDRRIGELLNEIRMMTRSEPWSRARAHRALYAKGGYRSRVRELVGYSRPGGPPELRTGVAYSTVYHAVFDALLGRCRETLTQKVGSPFLEAR